MPTQQKSNSPPFPPSNGNFASSLTAKRLRRLRQAKIARHPERPYLVDGEFEALLLQMEALRVPALPVGWGSNDPARR